jgi:hypothetical protein
MERFYGTSDKKLVEEKFKKTRLYKAVNIVDVSFGNWT